MAHIKILGYFQIHFSSFFKGLLRERVSYHESRAYDELASIFDNERADNFFVRFRLIHNHNFRLRKHRIIFANFYIPKLAIFKFIVLG